jgi:membrane protease YdiL (CAAX protease family)
MTSLPLDRRRPLAGTPLLLLFFAAAVAVRVGLTGPPGFGASPWPGVLFGALLAVVALVVGTATRFGVRTVVLGLAATAVIVLPALAFSSVHGSLPVAWFPAWLGATLVVAPAEEAFLRGVLYDAVASRWSVDVAIAVGAIAFGLMHVPFYGWAALPLDTAVGVVLGVARLASGTWVAPAIAHTAADVVGWWML